MSLTVTPILAPGHTLPDKPVYWLIWILDVETRKPYASRGFNIKHKTPAEAAKYNFGIPPTENMVFWNLSSSIVEGRKIMKQIQQEWIKAGGR